MIKDIPQLTVEDIGVCVVKEKDENDVEVWNVYVVNYKSDAIDGVLVTSSGYGLMNEEKKATTTLRHFLDRIEPMDFKKVEPIMEDTFGLTNEYWVSFYLDKKLYDKKFIFLPESITESNFIQVPIIFKRGVLIR